jgi:hypothetical protein
MSGKFTVSKAQAREMKKIAERMDRSGRGVPLEVIRQQMMDDMANELRRMTRAYVRNHKGGAQLLDCLAIAEVEGVDPALLAAIRREIGEAARKRKAA